MDELKRNLMEQKKRLLENEYSLECYKEYSFSTIEKEYDHIKYDLELKIREIYIKITLNEIARIKSLILIAITEGQT